MNGSKLSKVSYETGLGVTSNNYIANIYSASVVQWLACPNTNLD